MPFKVKFNIMEAGKVAPRYSTYDRALAYVELHEIQRRQGFLGIGLVPEITCVDLTKPEKYVWLVYRVLGAIRHYYDCGRKPEDLQVSLALEKELDNWNTRTRFYLNTHPKSTPDDPNAFAFFEVVEEWRNCWHRYFAYKKRRDKDEAVEREMKKQCFQMEKEIRKYVNLVIGI